MPGKSRRKQMRYASSKQNKTLPPQVAATTTTPAAATGTGTAVAGKPQTSSVKSSPAAKAAAAQYTPDLLKHVGTELKISVALSASILVVIIILAFILH
ncbi:MAG: hypothetical protein ACLPVI_07710 [Dehalococcoidales bacterium]